VPLQRFEAVEPHMGTLFRIELFAPDAATAQAAFQQAFARVTQLDQILTDYDQHSELSRVTRSAVQQPVPVSQELFAVLSTAQQLADDSGGAFDITVGPLTHLWRAARKAHQPPGSDAIAQAIARCGYRSMHLNPQQRTVIFDEEGMQLDAGAIAKGYAADEALAVITRRGIRSALVAASGDLAFSDAPPGQSGWRIGLADRVLVLSNGAVSTSGDSEQHMDYNGVRYSHIIDPRTGMALKNSPLVSISGKRAIETDAASTAVSVLGAAEGARLITRHPDLHIFLNSSR
jgi:thiamine biosynthesis lipoprotein